MSMKKGGVNNKAIFMSSNFMPLLDPTHKKQ